MLKTRITALIILLLGIGIGFFVYKSEVASMSLAPNVAPKGMARFPFKLGLDLSGGTHLVYKADLSHVPASEVNDSMNSLRDVIERRVNLFGVAEPSVQLQTGGISNPGEQRLIVDLPGVTKVTKAIKMIGLTPTLDFRTENPNFNKTTTATHLVVVRPI